MSSVPPETQIFDHYQVCKIMITLNVLITNSPLCQPRPQGLSLKKWVGLLRERPWGRGWPLCLYLHMVLFGAISKFHIMKFGNLVKICFRLNLVVIGEGSLYKALFKGSVPLKLTIVVGSWPNNSRPSSLYRTPKRAVMVPIKTTNTEF